MLQEMLATVSIHLVSSPLNNAFDNNLQIREHPKLTNSLDFQKICILFHITVLMGFIFWNRQP